MSMSDLLKHFKRFKLVSFRFYIELDLTHMLRPKNKGVGPEPCFMTGCLSRGGSLKIGAIKGAIIKIMFQIFGLFRWWHRIDIR